AFVKVHKSLAVAVQLLLSCGNIAAAQIAEPLPYGMFVRRLNKPHRLAAIHAARHDADGRDSLCPESVVSVGRVCVEPCHRRAPFTFGLRCIASSSSRVTLCSGDCISGTGWRGAS